MTSSTNPDSALIEGLEACPFCGSDKVRVADNTGPKLSCNAHAFVICYACCTDGPEKETVAEAIAAWNTRASAKPDEDVGLMREDIVLISQSMSMSGFETHGLFPTFEAALAHVCKDEGLQQAAWAKTTKSAAEFVYRNTRWVASREPARAALQGDGPKS